MHITRRTRKRVHLLLYIEWLREGLREGLKVGVRLSYGLCYLDMYMNFAFGSRVSSLSYPAVNSRFRHTFIITLYNGTPRNSNSIIQIDSINGYFFSEMLRTLSGKPAVASLIFEKHYEFLVFLFTFSLYFGWLGGDGGLKTGMLVWCFWGKVTLTCVGTRFRIGSTFYHLIVP